MVMVKVSRWAILSHIDDHPLPMIMVIMIIFAGVVMNVEAGRRLQQGIADMLGHGLARAVIPAVADPAGQLGHRRAFRVVRDRGRLRHRICVNFKDARAASEHGFGHVLRCRPLHSGHFQNGGRSRSRHLFLYIASSDAQSAGLVMEGPIPSGGILSGLRIRSMR